MILVGLPISGFFFVLLGLGVLLCGSSGWFLDCMAAWCGFCGGWFGCLMALFLCFCAVWRCVFGFAVGYGLDCQVVVFDFPGGLRFLWVI